MGARVDSYDPDAPRPKPNTVWAWEPTEPHAATLAVVIRCEWNGEEWWVVTATPEQAAQPPARRREHWNDLSRFWEACHAIRGEAGPEATTGIVTGPPQPAETTPPPPSQ